MKTSVILAIAAVFLGILFLADMPDDSLDLGERPTYDVSDLIAPRLNEFGYSIFLKFLKSWPIGRLLVWKIKRDSDFQIVEKLGAKLYNVPLHVPVARPTAQQLSVSAQAAAAFDFDKFVLDAPNNEIGTSVIPQALCNRYKFDQIGFKELLKSGKFHRWTADQFVSGYRVGKFSPVDVAKAVIAAVKQSDKSTPPLRAVIQMNDTDVLRMAAESWERIRAGKQLSPLDGVPILIKEEVDVAGYKNTYGTNGRIIGKVNIEIDAPMIDRLRNAGLLIVGKGNMHEFGVLPIGLNEHWGDARNPYNTAHVTGGSSSGPAAAVAAGLVPLAVGTDGGGSIRIPAALCGIVGLKPTHGRVPHPLPYTSVSVAGPMTATVKDNAMLYMALAGPHPLDENGLSQPAPHILGFENIQDLSDLRVGVYWRYFEDADPQIVAAAKQSLELLKKRGARIVDIEIRHLQVLDRAHKITIMSEFAMGVQMHWYVSEHDVAVDAQAPIVLGRSFSAKEFLAAQKIRRYLFEQWTSLFNASVDVILTPTTAIAAPKLEGRIVDTQTVSQLMRFITAGNFLGLPGISLPIGYMNETNLPIGLQIMARHWEEHVLLRVAHALETDLKRANTVPRRPDVFFDLFKSE